MFDSFNIDSVFDSFVDNMEKSGALKSPPKYSLPESMLDRSGVADIDVSGDLRKVAVKGIAKMYGVSSDDVVGDAHNGSVKVVDATGDLGVVETIQDAHKKIEDMATKKVKIAARIIALANDLADANLHEYAEELDSALADFLGVEVIAKTAAANEEYEGVLDQLNGLVLETVLGQGVVVDQYRNALVQQLEGLVMSPSAAGLKSFAKQYYKFLTHMWKLPEAKQAATAMYGAYADIMELVELGVGALETGPIQTDTAAPTKITDASQLPA